MLGDLPVWCGPLVSQARSAGEDIGAVLPLAAEYGRLLPLPGGGQTAARWAILAAVAEQNLAALHAGITDAALWASKAALASAAREVDGGRASGEAGSILSLRVRAIVADAAEQAIRQAGHALGPAPLAFNEDHARRVADLELYIRQQHAERDLARLGAAVAACADTA